MNKEVEALEAALLFYENTDIDDDDRIDHVLVAAQALLDALEKARVGRCEWHEQNSSYYTDWHMYVEPEQRSEFEALRWKGSGTVYFSEEAGDEDL